jgi:predicted Zn-dependent protease
MKKFILSLACFVLAGCSLQRGQLAWRVKDVVLEKRPSVELYRPNEQLALNIPVRTIQEMMLAHLRISRTAGVPSELYIVDGDEPNAFATFINNGQRIIGISLGMVKLVGGDINEYAALIGHEAAHWAKGHIDAGRTRTNTLNAIGTAVGVGLSAAGVPAAGLISGLGVDLIDASFDRDQEREADIQSIEYMVANNYDPRAAITLHEKFIKIDRGLRLPFLSSHPSSEERIKNLQALIEAKQPQRQ